MPRCRGLGTSASSIAIQAQIAAAAIAAGLDPTIALAQAAAESAYNPGATNPTSGAAGLFQFMPATAAQYGITNPYDPTQSINGRNAYYSSLLTQFGGDQSAALAAYDWGPGNVQNAQAKYGSNWLAYAPAETQNYVEKILGSVASAPAPQVQDSGFGTQDLTVQTAGLFGGDVSAPSGSSAPLLLGAAAVALVLGFFVLPEILD